MEIEYLWLIHHESVINYEFWKWDNFAVILSFTWFHIKATVFHEHAGITVSFKFEDRFLVVDEVIYIWLFMLCNIQPVAFWWFYFEDNIVILLVLHGINLFNWTLPIMGNYIVNSPPIAYHLHWLNFFLTIHDFLISFTVITWTAWFCLIFIQYICCFLNFKGIDKCSELFNQNDFISLILIHVSFYYLIFLVIVSSCVERACWLVQ